MEDENEFLSLPSDPEEAFAILQQRKYRQLEAIWQNNEGGGGWYAEREYATVLIAFDEVHNLGILTDFRIQPSRDSEFGDYFQNFRRVVEVSKQKILIEAARRAKSEAGGIVVLDSSARAAIHKFIDAIRAKLDDLNLPENKRENLFNKLNAFTAEVDRNRTRTEAMCAFAVEVARAGRAVNDEIKPLQETIDRLFDMLDKATKWKDALPPWSERKKIEPPSKQLPKPDLDDEIPF